MIDNGDVLRWSEPVEQSYMNAVDRLIVNISRHLKSGKAIHTAKWETQKLSEMGQLTAENAKIINDALKQMPQQMRDALDDTAKESLKLVDEAIEEAIQKGAVERSPISSTQGVIDELSQQALDQFNLVNTTMLQSTQTAYLKAINDTVMWENRMLSEGQKEATLETLNDATTAVLTGGETRQVALRRAIKELNDHGLYGFVDKAGRHWSPEAYVNMCMRTTVHNVAVRSVRGRQEEYGSSIFQCSYHPASRTEHYPFQNKFYDWNGQSGTFTDGNGQKHKYESVTVTGYGTAAGLFGINCGHLPLPQIPGVTIPTDPDMQSPERDEKEYKESQIQRRLERNIRQSKRLVDAYKAAGDDKGAEEAMDAVRMDQARMREFIERTGRHRRYDREQISGYGPDKLNRPKKKPKRTTPSVKLGRTVMPPQTWQFGDMEDFYKARQEYISTYGADKFEKLQKVQDGYDHYWGIRWFADDRDVKLDRAIRFDNTIAKLHTRFPLPDKSHLTVGDFDSVGQKLTERQRERMSDSATGQAWINPDTNESVIAYAMSYGGTLKDDLKRREEAIKNGRRLLSVFEGDSPEGVAIHEYGHRMSDFITNAMVYDDPVALEYFDWYQTLTEDDIKNGISSYAATNRGEFEAECFAELLTNNPRPLARKYGEYLQKCANSNYTTKGELTGKGKPVRLKY